MAFIRGAAAVAVFAIGATPFAASAQQATNTVALSLDPQALDQALVAIGKATGREIIIDAGATAGKVSRRLKGRFTADEAIRRLLAGSGLEANFTADVVLIRSRATPNPNGDGMNALDVVVTGSRIRGAEPASPTIVLTSKAIRDAGQHDLGEVARSLPQNFNGGQNPEIGNGVPDSNFNLNAGTALNLRGLGPDATLTLLNGHRLAYDGINQGVDISSIPVSVLDRVEIVPDGASALYGSDAVGGVANIILKRNFSGLETSARIAGATSGGGFEQEYYALAGMNWKSGGAYATYDFDRSAEIRAGQRHVLSALAPSTTILRPQRHHNAVLVAHQNLTDRLEIEVDGLFSDRRSHAVIPYTATGTYQDLGNALRAHNTSYSVAPRLSWNIDDDWHVDVSGLYARDRTRFEALSFSEGDLAFNSSGCQCNDLWSVEAGVEGHIFDLPGGDARLAAGGGYRRAELHYSRPGLDFTRHRGTVFGYGELSLPFVSTLNARPGLAKLAVSVAGRYEGYRGSGGTVTPKVGVIYAPLAGLEFKGAWGRSFKAPTLYQQYQPRFLYFYNASDLGVRGYPANAPFAILYGGAQDLKPERARTWTVSAVVAPSSFQGGRIELSYFNVAFKNRVEEPLTSIAGAVGNPSYAPLITYDPSESLIEELIADADGGAVNLTGSPVDNGSVAAVLNGRPVNVARETAKGVDIDASYPVALANGTTVTLSFNAASLRSRRLVLTGLPSIQLAGTIFNPARFRARGGAVWNSGVLTASTYVNYIGGINDVRSDPIDHVHGQTTIDAAIRFTPQSGVLRRTELALTVRNLLNDMPAAIKVRDVYATPYDSTNYSVIGRFVSASIITRW